MNAKWIVTAIVVGGAAGAYLSRQPWAEFRRQNAVAKDAESEMRDAERERAKLEKEVSGSESEVGREAIAREHGYRRKGETPAEDSK